MAPAKPALERGTVERVLVETLALERVKWALDRVWSRRDAPAPDREPDRCG